eukprot:4602943-Pyramimonas_sp.AAC.1
MPSKRIEIITELLEIRVGGVSRPATTAQLGLTSELTCKCSKNGDITFRMLSHFGQPPKTAITERTEHQRDTSLPSDAVICLSCMFDHVAVVVALFMTGLSPKKDTIVFHDEL